MVSPNDETETRGEGGTVGLKELRPPEDLAKEVKKWGAADIRFVLPAHRGAKLMLDQVESYPNSKVVGRLAVAPDRCVGFCFLNGEELAITGADLIEMAAQLLGVFGYHFREVFAERYRKFVLASVNRAEFHKPVKAGETVCVEIAVDNIRVKVREGPEFQQFVIRGEDFVIKVGDEVRGKISGITLMSTPTKKTKTSPREPN
jgi:predicted hotdog family 3-hydroxylacyl-ACP dehydratase